MQKLTKFKVIFDIFTVCVYFIQQQNCKIYYIYLMIISEIQSEIGHCSCDSAKFKAPADFSNHAILCMTLSLIPVEISQCLCREPVNQVPLKTENVIKIDKVAIKIAQRRNPFQG